TGLGDRFDSHHLAAFIANPASRYPDGRMPAIPLTDGVLPKEEHKRYNAADIAAFLLLWSKPTIADQPTKDAVTPEEIATVAKRLGVHEAGLGQALLREKGCHNCHPGLESKTDSPSINHGGFTTTALGTKGCLSKKSLPRFNLDEASRQAVLAYLTRAS